MSKHTAKISTHNVLDIQYNTQREKRPTGLCIVFRKQKGKARQGTCLRVSEGSKTPSAMDGQVLRKFFERWSEIPEAPGLSHGLASALKMVSAISENKSNMHKSHLQYTF